MVASATDAGFNGFVGTNNSVKSTAALSGAKSLDIYGVSSYVRNAVTGSTTGYTYHGGLFFSVENQSMIVPTGGHYLDGIFATATSSAGTTTKRISGVRANVQLTATSAITDFAAALYVTGPTSLATVGTDISKVYKIYQTGYGRNYFGQPGDAGLYAAEVVGDKGLLAGGANGQFQLSDVGSRPTCDAAHRGSFWYEAGGVGVADTVEVCRKDAGNAYAWVSVI